MNESSMYFHEVIIIIIITYEDQIQFIIHLMYKHELLAQLRT